VKLKIAVYVSHPRLENIFFESNIFTEMKEKYDLTVVRFFNNRKAYLDSNHEVIEFFIPNLIYKLQKFVLDLETFRARNQNVSFASRIRIITNLSFRYDLNIFSFLKTKNKYGLLLSILGSKFFYFIFGPVLRLTSDILPFIFFPNFFFKKFDLAITFSGGNFSGMENSVGRFLRYRNIINILLIDNWDNLSSKSKLWIRPKRILVWGQNMKNDAIQIQNFKEEEILITGSYRIDKLPESFSKNSKTIVYFVGSGLQHSYEVEILMNLALYLDKFGDKGVKVVYRPHPYTLRNHKMDYLRVQISNFKNIEIDQDILNKINGVFYTEDSMRKLETSIIDAALVVGLHSTVIVEALYFGKKVVAYSTAEHGIFMGQNLWDMYTHLHQIRSFNNLYETRSRTDFFKQILLNIENRGTDPVDFSAIAFRNEDFAKLFINLVDELMSN